MSRNLETRIQRLEESGGNLPNGGIVCVFARANETEADAWQRKLRGSWVMSLTTTQRRQLVPVVFNEADAGL